MKGAHQMLVWLDCNIITLKQADYMWHQLVALFPVCVVFVLSLSSETGCHIRRATLG